ncbi:MAG TPA: PqqD family protein [Novosphingobium sp.]|nr:PqqD family protein [Novosphingobium sp.]
MSEPAKSVTVTAGGDVVACELGSGAALLCLRSNRYFSLNEVGAFIWNRMERPIDIDALCHAVTGAFDVEPERCRRDVAAIVRSLAEAGLAVVATAGADA